MKIKNIGKVSEHNLRVYVSNFQWGIISGTRHPEDLKNEYKSIFTEKEMNYIIKNAFKGEIEIKV